MGQVVETAASQVIETDDFGRLVIPAELLGTAKPHTRFVIETDGEAFVIQPEVVQFQEDSQELTDEKQLTNENWERQWKIAQEQVSKSWPAGVSATDVISEMRR